MKSCFAKMFAGMLFAPCMLSAQILPGLRSPDGEVQLAGSLTDAAAAEVFTFVSTPDAQVISGDWNGDGLRTIGARTPDGKFLLRNENSEGEPDIIAEIPGNPKGIPVAGRWKGGKRWGIGVFSPDDGTWTLSLSAENPKADIVVYFGQPGDLPVVGDWDGDGVDTIGIVRPTPEGDILVWMLCNSNESPSEDKKFTFGSKAHLPVIGDWDGDGLDTPGLLNRQGGIWVLTNSTEKPDEQVIVMKMLPELNDAQPFVWGTGKER